MPLSSYGVLTARVVDVRREGAPDDTPHYQIHLTDNAGTNYRAAVNVKSAQAPSELLYFAADDFRHPLTARLPQAGSGWNELPTEPGGTSLDYIRANVVDRSQMRPVPPDAEGPNNDLADFLDHYVRRAQQDPSAHAYVFGEPWGPEDKADKIFGFKPGNGVHNVHMNQGNTGRFREDDGVWQDGGLLLHFPGENRWVAIFLAFQSQSWHTDDRTGHAIEGEAPPEQVPAPEPAAIPLQVIAAAVNPVGGGRENETVTLINASAAAVDLRGWKLADGRKNTMELPASEIAAGQTVQVPVSDGFQLGNRGGAITLLNPEGLKVHGVSYTDAQARTEGWTIVF
ncbi:DUF2278 family protein [Saccharopolyspora taberi]|uniref:LTD domain-containing protein n=1 Tax=Saccharopolyspora taberi TaxID=60895 RepID=A0ABN3VG52_9PSEU